MSPKKSALILSALFALLLCASAFADFQVSSFELDKSKVLVAPGLPAQVEATVLVRNLGAGSANARVAVSVKGPDGTEVVALLKEFEGPFGQAPTEVNFSPDNFFAFSVANAPGNYTFYASVYNDGPPVSLDGQQIRVLTLALKRDMPIPEFPPMLSALVAFSAIAILFFSSRQKISKL